jgi:tellurite resistance protein TerA
LFKRLTGGGKVDLDLGCLFEMQDGGMSVIQALGNAFGNFRDYPYIQLSADDRTGQSVDGEWLRINGQHWREIKRVVIFAFIYGGVPNWAATDGVVTIYVPDQPPIEVRLTEGQALGMCGIVELSNIGGSIQVNRHVRYVKGHRELDQLFGFGLRWQAGSK